MKNWELMQALVSLPVLANRHSSITGATSTCKTVTLQRITEQFCVSVCRYSYRILKWIFPVLVLRGGAGGFRKNCWRG
jgi:hypothetical protein